MKQILWLVHDGLYDLSIHNQLIIVSVSQNDDRSDNVRSSMISYSDWFMMVFMTRQLVINWEPYQPVKVMTDLIVLSLFIGYWSMATWYVVNGIQYQRWLKIVALTDSLLTDGQMIDGNSYQFWLKQLYWLSPHRFKCLVCRKAFPHCQICVFILPCSSSPGWFWENDGHQYFGSISSQLPWV